MATIPNNGGLTIANIGAPTENNNVTSKGYVDQIGTGIAKGVYTFDYAIPILTSNTDPLVVTVSASVNNSDAYKAFRRGIDPPEDGWISTTGIAQCSLTARFDNIKYCCNMFEIQAIDGLNNAISWSIEARNNTSAEKIYYQEGPIPTVLTQLTPTSPPTFANTFIYTLVINVDTNTQIGIRQFNLLSGQLNAHNYRLISLAPPIANDDAATKQYVDSVFRLLQSHKVILSEREPGSSGIWPTNLVTIPDILVATSTDGFFSFTSDITASQAMVTLILNGRTTPNTNISIAGEIWVNNGLTSEVYLSSHATFSLSQKTNVASTTTVINIDPTLIYGFGCDSTDYITNGMVIIRFI